MFKLPSLQNEYTLCSIHDPALALPEVPAVDRDNDPPEAIKAADEVLQERQRQYQSAVDGAIRWDAITKPGERPTVFTFVPMHGPTFTWWQAEAARRNMSADEGYELAFRLAIKSITNLGKSLEVKRMRNDEGRTIATEKSIEPLYDIGRDAGEPQLGRAIVLELGAIVLTKAVTSPLS
jgi:hypothetical protein